MTEEERDTTLVDTVAEEPIEEPFEEETVEEPAGEPVEEEVVEPVREDPPADTRRLESTAERAGGALAGLLGGMAARVPEPGPPEPGADLSDLFQGPDKYDNDVYTGDLTSVGEEDVMGGPSDMSDLLEVDEEDVMGDEPDDPTPQPRPTVRYRRTAKRYPPTSGAYPPVGGVRGMG